MNSHCSTRVHCGVCRNRIQGVAIRRSLLADDEFVQLRHQAMLDESADAQALELALFKCPYGIPDSYLGRSEEEVEAMIEEHCDACPHQVLLENDESGCKLIGAATGGPCITRYYELLRAGGPCPAGRF